MAKTYERCGKDVDDLIAEVMRRYHQELSDLGVTVDPVFVSAEDAKGMTLPGLKRNGLPAAAMIQVTPLADRARGLADTKLTIDSHVWNHLPPHQREALIDHELEHVQLKPVEDEDGNVEHTDDLGRPRLKLKP